MSRRVAADKPRSLRRTPRVRVEAADIAAPKVDVQLEQVAGFTPSSCGFYFRNSPPSVPYEEVTIQYP